MTPIFTCQDGEVFRRSIFMDEGDCRRLLAQFRATAADKSDYFHTDAGVLADQLEQAMREAGQLQQQERAA